jgi:hypothetical protein
LAGPAAGLLGFGPSGASGSLLLVYTTSSAEPGCRGRRRLPLRIEAGSTLSGQFRLLRLVGSWSQRRLPRARRALSPINGIDPFDLKIDELVRRVPAGGAEEVVIATNPTSTGEATAHHFADLLRERVTITRLASSLRVGGPRAR